MLSLQDLLTLRARNDHVSYFKLPGSTRGPRHNYPTGMRNKLMESTTLFSS